MPRTLVTGPAEEPVTRAEAKLWARIAASLTADDATVDALITAARRHIEDVTGRITVNQTWKLILDTWPRGRAVRLPLAPLVSVTHVKVYDSAGAATTMDSADYIVDTANEPGRIVLKDDADWPSPSAGLQEANAFEVQFVAGYGADASSVPEELKTAVKMIVAHLYENREETQATALARTQATALARLPLGVRHLLAPYQLFIRAPEAEE